MEADMYLIDFAAALFVGILAGLGVGSGGLFLMYLTLLRDVPQKEAQGINLLFFLFALAGSVMVHVCRRAVSDKLLGILFLSGMPGAICGSLLIRYLPVSILRTVFGTMLMVMGVMTLFDKKRGENSHENANNA